MLEPVNHNKSRLCPYLDGSNVGVLSGVLVLVESVLGEFAFS